MNMAVKIFTVLATGLSANSAGMKAHCRIKGSPARELEQEHQHVQADEGEGDDRGSVRR